MNGNFDLKRQQIVKLCLVSTQVYIFLHFDEIFCKKIRDIVFVPKWSSFNLPKFFAKKFVKLCCVCAEVYIFLQFDEIFCEKIRETLLCLCQVYIFLLFDEFFEEKIYETLMCLYSSEDLPSIWRIFWQKASFLCIS